MRDSIGKHRRLCVLLFFIFASQLSYAWWNEQWSYRKKISFDEATLAQTQSLGDDFNLLLRLHPGNFNFFMDVREDGADLRFIAGDDTTPLKYHIESYNPYTGIGILWIHVPKPTKNRPFFYMYYGNQEAVSASEPGASFDKNQTLVMHFSELSGMPQDNTAYSNNAARFSGRLQAAGQIDNGAAFNPADQLVIASTPALGIDTERGNTLSFWLKLEETADGQTAVAAYSGRDAALTLDLLNGRLAAYLKHQNNIYSAEALTALGVKRWYHVAVTLGGGEMQLFIDGNPVASSAVPALASAAGLTIGATESVPGFKGVIDELRMSSTKRNAVLFRLEAQGESPEGSLVSLGEDEQQRSANPLTEYFDLVASMFESIRFGGWAIILLLAAIGIAAIDVIISKIVLLRNAERADNAFLAGFNQQTGTDLIRAHGSSEEEATAYGRSGLYRLYRSGIEEHAQMVRESGQHTGLGVEGLQSIRSSMEVQLVAEQDRLNARMVVTTIAVSGGPFLGLLGTVMGVMLTFAAIAKAGDVNVNTIAPGVAAALVTTVMGLLVAIPALFGYNYVAGRIARRIAVMEVFLEQFMSKLSRAALLPSATEPNAAASVGETYGQA